MNSSFGFGHCLSLPSATGGEQKLPLYQGLRCQTLRYVTACGARDIVGRAVTEAYGRYINTSGHLRATIPAILQALE